ncbi:MAG: hypothetical protein ACR2QT_03035 [Woeseiaceae bacterium]
MSLFAAVVNKWVLLAALPYAAIAAYDFRLHDTDREVPTAEGACHATVITCVLLFLALAALGLNGAAALALVVLLVAAVIDELAFHAHLHVHEKRLHYLGGAALAFCIGVWLWTI